MQQALLAACCGVAAVSVGAINAPEEDAELRALVVEAVERMNDELQTVAGRYRARMTSEEREFDGSGEVAEETRVEWESIPLDGARAAATISGLGCPWASPSEAASTLSTTAGQKSKTGHESSKSAICLTAAVQRQHRPESLAVGDVRQRTVRSSRTGSQGFVQVRHQVVLSRWRTGPGRAAWGSAGRR